MNWVIFFHKICKFSLKSNFFKGYQTNQNEKLTKTDSENCFWGKQNDDFLLSVPSCFFSHAIYKRQKTLHLAPRHICEHLGLLLQPHVPWHFPSTSFYRECPPLGTKKQQNSPQRAKRRAAQALSSTVTQFSNHHFTAKSVMPEYIQVALSVRGYLLLAVIHK